MGTKVTKTVGSGVPAGIGAAAAVCTLAICPPLAPFVGLGFFLASQSDIKEKATEHGCDDAAETMLRKWERTREVGESHARVSITKPFGTVHYEMEAEGFEDYDLARAETPTELTALYNAAGWEKRDDISMQLRRRLRTASDIVDVARAYSNLSLNRSSHLDHDFHVTLMNMIDRETSVSRLSRALNCLDFGQFSLRDRIDRRIQSLR